MFRAVALILAGLAVTTPGVASARALTRVEMESLARAGVHSICPTLPPSVVSFETYRRGDYVVFEAMGVLPGSASIHPCSPFYVVDPATGDMWDGVTECGAITSRAIRQLQARLRARIGLGAASYARIRRRGPMCDQE